MQRKTPCLSIYTHTHTCITYANTEAHICMMIVRTPMQMLTHKHTCAHILNISATHQLSLSFFQLLPLSPPLPLSLSLFFLSLQQTTRPTFFARKFEASVNQEIV